MLLRASSEKAGFEAKLEGAVGEGDGGVVHGAILNSFGEVVTRGVDDPAPARQALRDALGPDGFVEACCIVGIFNGLVRTADASGVPLDDGTLDSTVGFREALGLNEYGGAANTELERADESRAPDDVRLNFS